MAGSPFKAREIGQYWENQERFGIIRNVLEKTIIIDCFSPDGNRWFGAETLPASSVSEGGGWTFVDPTAGKERWGAYMERRQKKRLPRPRPG